jgi:hypothetical protein
MIIDYSKPALIMQCGKCEEVIQSQNRHDFRRCKCGEVFVDGGNDYARYGLGSNYVGVILKEFGIKRRKD